jgi:hypothetical protein
VRDAGDSGELGVLAFPAADDEDARHPVDDVHAAVDIASGSFSPRRVEDDEDFLLLHAPEVRPGSRGRRSQGCVALGRRRETV